MGTRFIHWNYSLLKAYENLFNIRVFHVTNLFRTLNYQLKGHLWEIPSDLKHLYNKDTFMVIVDAGIHKIYPTSEIILGIPNELFDIFSNLKPISFKIITINRVSYEQDNRI